jgi:hypothetical protein
MSSTYPATLDTFDNALVGTKKLNDPAQTHTSIHNDIADALNKIEAELGVNPSQAEATVAALLAKLLDKTIATTKGDLLAATAASTLARLGVGTDGQVLKAASGETTGMKWDTALAIPAQDDWTAPTLLNSWQNIGGSEPPAGYYKDSLGIIHIRGAVKSGSSITATVFTLPAGYRPAYYARGGAASDIDGTSAEIVLVSTNGNVSFRGGGTVDGNRICEFTFRAA